MTGYNGRRKNKVVSYFGTPLGRGKKIPTPKIAEEISHYTDFMYPHLTLLLLRALPNLLPIVPLTLVKYCISHVDFYGNLSVNQTRVTRTILVSFKYVWAKARKHLKADTQL